MTSKQQLQVVVAKIIQELKHQNDNAIIILDRGLMHEEQWLNNQLNKNIDGKILREGWVCKNERLIGVRHELDNTFAGFSGHSFTISNGVVSQELEQLAEGISILEKHNVCHYSLECMAKMNAPEVSALQHHDMKGLIQCS